MPLPSESDLQRWLDSATEAALAAGAVLQHHWGNLTSIDEKGRSGDLVTEADRGAEAAVMAVLERHLPADHGILAEESGVIRGREASLLWAIDPLDGTTNYTHQYPFCAVSIGLLAEGEPVLGVIYDPVHRDLFRAATGLGATLNRRPIHVSTTDRLDQSLLVTGFAYDRRETPDNNYAEFCHFTHLSQGVRRGGAAAIDLAYVACGRLDGYWERGLAPWDIAAGIVLVREAGGKVTAYDGSPMDVMAGRLLATNGHLHQAMSHTLGQIKPLVLPPLT
ncbi:inositol monophosphatase [Nodosilinea sp. LEGE 06152]|uniref:inositol monophosphatase family protein n=1 Tax=Nodosilinea sp. LEGE 06152 TaxID=2777966 RepID=UPI00187F2006|nr:inositol monophosphatase family protein [Nodosilinea sp. LEGE 06152]MBE9157144.1 inositol monophosphatase [Nodosilinea sp. LEGE 06152]MBE9158469.1 inositol monophosphatase [Nodosilinea sp. LEGE 06152]